MRIDTPDPRPRAEGNYEIWASGGYGDPNGEIVLDEKRELRLVHVTVDDCDRLIRAAAEIKSRLLAYTAEMTAPHGRKHLYKGTCQLCGKPEDDELHAEPRPLTVSESTLRQCQSVEDDIAAGTWPPAPSGMQQPAPVVRVLDVPVSGTATVTGWCPAETVHDGAEFGVTVYCDREKGHTGSHHAPGPDEGSEVAWSDEPQAVAL